MSQLIFAVAIIFDTIMPEVLGLSCKRIEMSDDEHLCVGARLATCVHAGGGLH